MFKTLCFRFLTESYFFDKVQNVYQTDSLHCHLLQLLFFTLTIIFDYCVLLRHTTSVSSKCPMPQVSAPCHKSSRVSVQFLSSMAVRRIEAEIKLQFHLIVFLTSSMWSVDFCALSSFFFFFEDCFLLDSLPQLTDELEPRAKEL